jgi:hypothetical protein
MFITPVFANHPFGPDEVEILTSAFVGNNQAIGKRVRLSAI